MKKLYYFILLVALVALTGATLPASAQTSDPQWNFVSVDDTSACGTNEEYGTYWGAYVSLERINIQGNGVFYWETVATSGGLIVMDEFFSTTFPDGIHQWGIYDADDRGLQQTSFADLAPGATVNVTITLRASDGETMLDQDTFSFTCGTAPEPEKEEKEEDPVVEPIAVPGCDALIPIPATAVGATLTRDAEVFWTPGKVSDEVFPAGLNVRAIGLDDSGAYYKVLYVCDFYWVEAGTIGPNYEYPWNGAALPTAVVN